MKKIRGFLITLLILIVNIVPVVGIHSNINYKAYYSDLYSYKVENITFRSSNLTLYGEIYFPDNKTQIYPGLIFVEGYSSCINYYQWIPKHLAQNGYVVLIFDLPGQGKSEGIFPDFTFMFENLCYYPRYTALIETPFHYFKGECVRATKDALTYLLHESPVKHLIDQSNIGLIGHSLGGIIVTKTVLEDTRVKTLIVLSNGDPKNVENIDIPVQYQGGDMDIFFMSIPQLLSCYQKTNSHKELIVISLGTHISFMNKLYPFCLYPRYQKEIILHYTIGWFDYYLQKNEEAYTIITSGHAHLSHIVKSRYNFGEGDQFI
jgi:pimeloyl-ACP methyl ester carboxylesterase